MVETRSSTEATQWDIAIEVIVESVDIEFIDDDRMAIALTFNDSSVIGGSPPVTVSALADCIVAKAPVELAANAVDWASSLAGLSGGFVELSAHG